MDRLYIRFFILLLCCAITSCATISYKYRNFCPRVPKSCRIATYNIYYQNTNCHPRIKNSAVTLINTINADIFLLQESTPFWQSCARQHFKKKYPYQMFHDCKARQHEDGMGILSKYPIIQMRFIPPVYGWFPACLYLIATPCGPLQVLNVHLNPPLESDNNIGFMGYALFTTPKIREKEMRDFTRYLNPHIPTIVAGDFNESDGGRAVQYLRRCAFVDGLSSVDHRIITWYWNMGLVTLFGRYDHVMYSPNVIPLNCQVLQEGNSDHFPVILDFRVP